MRDLTQHLTTRADDSHAPPVYQFPSKPGKGSGFPDLSSICQAQVRFFALHRIKPHAPPLVRAPVNSFEFQPCGCSPQAGYLTRLLRHWKGRAPNAKYPSFRAWTTRVSNPVCSPRFRASTSVLDQCGAFATGILPNIYAFHRYTENSPHLFHTQDRQFQKQAPS